MIFFFTKVEMLIISFLIFYQFMSFLIIQLFCVYYFKISILNKNCCIIKHMWRDLWTTSKSRSIYAIYFIYSRNVIKIQ